MYNPIATYRFQFHKDFSFDRLEAAIPYLKKLGISTLYASPIFEATPGSTHGYDGLDPHKINPEVGTEDQFLEIAKTLKQYQIGWLQDIVPNHMAFDTKNRWLMDVLEKGQKSEYANFFDLSWTGKIFQGRIMVPFLGSPLKEVIANNELKIDYKDQRLVFNYFDSYYPLGNLSYVTILESCRNEQPQALQQILFQINDMRHVEDPKTYALAWNEFLGQFSSLMKHESFSSAVLNCINTINGNPDKLLAVSDEQVYQLSYWQRTDRKINFRRFFTVNGLIALNIHDKEVFDYHHQYLKSLVDKDVIQGLRIDHIDGLFDPTGYLYNLRMLMGKETFIVVEKILEPGEEMLTNWPIQGNSGYDFLSIINNLFTYQNSKQQFTDYYSSLVQDDTPVHQQILEKKAYILTEHMGGELDNLTRLFKQLNLADNEQLELLKPDELSLAIGEMLIQCPVYRYYGNQMPLQPTEAAAIKNIFDQIKGDKNQLSSAVDLLEQALLVRPHDGDEAYNANALRFYQRYMQFTGPLMAKGVEDTLMYTYNRFIGHNEVGDAPEAFGISTSDYHELMVERQRRWPLSINATSTHDTKRGEDARARLNVLTAIPDEWFAAVDDWRQMNAELKTDGAPTVNDEYFIYQTLTAVYAMPGQDEDDIANRMQEYLQKALREAKTNSNWTTPEEAYEQATKDFAINLLDKSKPFWKSFTAFHHKVARFGVVNSLAQVLLRFTSPGVPDTYQGTELWDFSLVDPDNRRSVNYEQLDQWLNDVEEQSKTNTPALLTDLWSNPFDPKIKLWLTHTLFKLRRQMQEVFSQGEYVPLKVEGRYHEHVIAFARKYQKDVVVVVAPLHIAVLCQQQQCDIAELDWADTHIVLPANIKGEAADLFTGESIGNSRRIAVQKMFVLMPFALLGVAPPVDQKRAAGILTHITSLPSPYGIGDMGPEARKFADFLHNAGQKYWQILPLNPTENGQGHSPYSAISSRAGNTLLISPQMLVEEGLLTDEEVREFEMESTAKVDFEAAEQAKDAIFSKAWNAYLSGKASHLSAPFRSFCKQEKEWLDDFALYLVLKAQQKGKPWFEWPNDLRERNSALLQKTIAENQPEIDRIKWLQFIFLQQWKAFKAYCNEKDVQLFGDLPFYASYDSLDVWSNPEIFGLDEAGAMAGVAGVPPDGFSADGQLWGMPVFKWEVLRENNYEWWMERLRKNAQLFDLLRLDHFRAFADYWEVPAGDKTARNGKWQLGPRSGFFREIKKQLGDFPFVAEDLGEINEPVYELRDEFNMPGMKVLQFAFGDDMPKNNYIPHNYSENFIVYTGTHDNNTTRGWYRTDADGGIHQRINQYTGQQVTEQNVHEVFMRMAYSSVAKIAIIPIQDLLGLDETARMNKPASIQNNWSWRLLPGQVNSTVERQLKEMTELYNR